MSKDQAAIVFVDNSVNRIFKTVESLKSTFPNIKVFSHENPLLEFLAEEPAEIIFLHLDLQPNDAVMLLKEIRNRYPDSTHFIVIYTEKQDDFVQELAFNSGADSFINFFNKAPVLELFIKNLLKRRTIDERLTNKSLTIDHETYLIYRNGMAFQLPRKEFKLFDMLYKNADKYFSKTEIASEIWLDENIAKKRTIDVHIYNIRQLFGKQIIQSQKGKGYRINKKLLRE